jgi:endoglucanase
LKLAEENHIPCQMRQPGGGGTDAGAIHVSRTGVPSISVSIPIRYPHSPISLAKIKDWEYTMTLLNLAMNQIDRSILAAER